MGLDVINMLWVGDALSPVEQLSIQSYMDQGHPVHLYVYNDVKYVPKGACIKDANEIIAENRVFKHANSYAAFADMFRWKLMDLGLGYWSDTDVVCIRPFVHEKSVVVGKQTADCLTPTILKGTEVHNRLAADMYDISLRPLDFLPQDTCKRVIKKLIAHGKKRLLGREVYAVGWGETAGPDGLTKYYDYYKDELDIQIVEPIVWYPIPWENWQDIIVDSRCPYDSLSEETLGVHLWNEMWKRSGIDKWKAFPKHSLIGELMRMHGIT